MLRIRSYAPQWEATQDNLKLQMQRQLFGLHMPMRILMERKLVSQVRSCTLFVETVPG